MFVFFFHNLSHFLFVTLNVDSLNFYEVTGKINKLLKAYGRNRRLGKHESTAIADSFTEVFPGKPVPEIEEVKVEVDQVPTTELTPSITSFGGRPRPKKQ